MYYLELARPDGTVIEGNFYVDSADALMTSLFGEPLFTFLEERLAGDTIVDLITAWQNLIKYPEAYVGVESGQGWGTVADCTYLLSGLSQAAIMNPNATWKAEY